MANNTIFTKIRHRTLNNKEWGKIPFQYVQWSTIEFSLIKNEITYHSNLPTASLPISYHWFPFPTIQYSMENLAKGYEKVSKMTVKNIWDEELSKF